jgi:hypothetical protein
VFTARYALSPYIKQIRFVFKGLIQGGEGPQYRIFLSSFKGNDLDEHDTWVCWIQHGTHFMLASSRINVTTHLLFTLWLNTVIFINKTYLNNRLENMARLILLLWVFVLSDRDLCERPIPLPEESYRLWCVSECDQMHINNLDTYCE